MKVHIVGTAILVLSVIIGIIMLPSEPSITGKLISEQISSQANASVSAPIEYEGKECTTRTYKYSSSAESSADCSSKEKPYSCIAECVLRVANKEETAGNFSFEGMFSWKGETKKEVIRKEISPIGNAQYRFIYHYKTDDTKKVPSCSFKPVIVPEETICTDVVRTRMLP